MLHSYIGVHALQEGDKKKEKLKDSCLFPLMACSREHLYDYFLHDITCQDTWQLSRTNPQCFVFCQEHTHTNTIKSVLTGDWQMWKVRGNLRQECKGRGRKVWIFSDPVEIKPVGFFCSWSSNLLYLFRRVGGEIADVLYLQMAKVNLQSVDG